MAKILIAGIGGGIKKDGQYRVANYEIEGKIYNGRTFITSAIEEHYGIDKTIYIGTTGSMWDNLYQHYCKKFQVEEDENYLYSLMETIENSNKNFKNMEIASLDLTKFNEQFKDKVEGRITKYGLDESEIFENFNIIMDLNDILEEGDEIYLDITHSFRSNAMWMFLVMNYINDVVNKNIEIKKITYGMLEVSGGNNNISPVVDLNAFYKLLKWIKSASEFINYGNTLGLLELVDSEDVRKKMRNFSVAMSMNYVGSIRQTLKSLKNIEEKIDTLQGPAKILIPNVVKKFIKDFGDIESDYVFLAKLAKWHYEHKRYALAYININEAIKGYVEEELQDCKEVETKGNLTNEYARATKFLGILKSIYNSINKDAVKYKKNEYPKLYNIFKMYEHSKKVRNDIAHSLGGKDSAVGDIDSLKKYCETIEELISEKDYVYNVNKEWDILR